MKKVLLLLAIVVMPGAFANQTMFGPVTTGTATGTAAQVLAQNTLRSYVIIVNTGATNPIYVTFNAGNAGVGIPIPPGGNYEPFRAPSSSIWVSTASSTSTYSYVEGQ